MVAVVAEHHIRLVVVVEEHHIHSEARRTRSVAEEHHTRSVVRRTQAEVEHRTLMDRIPACCQ